MTDFQQTSISDNKKFLSPLDELWEESIVIIIIIIIIVWAYTEKKWNLHSIATKQFFSRLTIIIIIIIIIALS